MFLRYHGNRIIFIDSTKFKQRERTTQAAVATSKFQSPHCFQQLLYINFSGVIIPLKLVAKFNDSIFVCKVTRFPVVLTKYVAHLLKLEIIPMIPVTIICKKSAPKLRLKRPSRKCSGNMTARGMTDLPGSFTRMNRLQYQNSTEFSPNVLKLKITILNNLRRLNFHDVHLTLPCLMRCDCHKLFFHALLISHFSALIDVNENEASNKPIHLNESPLYFTQTLRCAFISTISYCKTTLQGQ